MCDIKPCAKCGSNAGYMKTCQTHSIYCVKGTCYQRVARYRSNVSKEELIKEWNQLQDKLGETNEDTKENR